MTVYSAITVYDAMTVYSVITVYDAMTVYSVITVYDAMTVYSAITDYDAINRVYHNGERHYKSLMGYNDVPSTMYTYIEAENNRRGRIHSPLFILVAHNGFNQNSQMHRLTISLDGASIQPSACVYSNKV